MSITGGFLLANNVLFLLQLDCILDVRRLRLYVSLLLFLSTNQILNLANAIIVPRRQVINIRQAIGRVHRQIQYVDKRKK